MSSPKVFLAGSHLGLGLEVSQLSHADYAAQPGGPSVLITHSHTLADDEARQRVVALTDYWSIRYGMTGAWRGERYQIQGKTKGIRFDATFTIAPGRVEVLVKVPFFARSIGREYVERKLRDYLDPAVSIEALRARLQDG